MSRIDETLPFIPVRFAVLAVSDTRSLETDKSGQTLADRITAAGHVLAERAIVPDDVDEIRAIVSCWIAEPTIDVVITTGGTGFTGRDVTPDAVEPLFEKRMDGFSAVFHRISYDKIGTSTVQSRSTAGLANSTFIFVVPARRAPARTHGTASSRRNSTIVTSPAISSRSCLASTNI